MIQGLVFFHGLMIIVTGGTLLLFSRIKDHRLVERSILLGLFNLCVIFIGALSYPLDGFGRFQLLAWGVFLYFPAFLLGSAMLSYRQARRYTSILVVLIFCIVGITIDAFLIEPNLLEIFLYQ